MEALSGCSVEDKDKFMQIGSIVSEAVISLGVCEQPQVCLVSEAYECINKFTTILKSFDETNDTEALCV